MTSQSFTASVWQEDDTFIAQCREVDVVSQGDTVVEALANLKEALELYFEPPMPTQKTSIYSLEVSLAA